jgi:hypothetical protein
MNLQSIALTGGSALVANGAAQTLHTPVPVNGRNVFRRVYGLRVSTGGLATGIRFDPANAHFSLAFEPDSDPFDIRGSADVTSKGGQALIVELPTTLRVTSARFAGVTGAQTIDIHRLDGDKLVDDAFDTFSNNGNVSDNFTDMRFALRLRNASSALLDITPAKLADVDVKGFPTAARVGVALASQGPGSAFFFWIVPGEVGKDTDSPSGSADLGAMLANVLQQEIDSLEPPYASTIDFLLVVESDAPCRFRAHSFTIPYGVVRASLRGVLLRSGDISDAAAFATHLRDANTLLTSYLRGKLSTFTQAALDQAERAPSAHILTAVVNELNQALQSEAFYSEPRFAGIALTPETLATAQASPTGIARTRLNRALLAEAFARVIAPITEPSDDEKEVLQINGASSTLDVAIDLPRTATIRSATILLEGDLRGGAPADTSATGNGTAPPAWDAPIPDQLGLTVDAGRAIAHRIEPGNATDATAISLALSCTSPGAELVAEIREDQDGTPAGRVLASGSALAGRLDQPTWVRFEFRTPVIVQGRPHWIVLRTTRGAVLWLAVDNAAISRAGTLADKRWSDLGSFDDVALLYYVWARAAKGTALTGTGPVDLANRLRVTIGTNTISPFAGQSGRARMCAITLPLQQWLAAQPGTAPIVKVPIRIAALGSGSVTVHPPEVEYDP